MVDVCSVKVRPLAILREELPAGTRVVGTHPLFGPASGREGLSGLPVVVCGHADGGRLAVERFLRDHLALDVVRSTPEAHDREMAQVQALSHLIARSVKPLVDTSPSLKTAAFRQLEELVALIGADSDALFDTIVGGNPFAPELLRRFVAAASGLVASATCGADG